MERAMKASLEGRDHIGIVERHDRCEICLMESAFKPSRFVRACGQPLSGPGAPAGLNRDGNPGSFVENSSRVRSGSRKQQLKLLNALNMSICRSSIVLESSTCACTLNKSK
jgi:hypothetical protein